VYAVSGFLAVFSLYKSVRYLTYQEKSYSTMAVVAVSTWIVRSPTHQYEILSQLDKTGLKIENARVDGGLVFEVHDFEDVGMVEVSMDDFGLFTFKFETQDGEIQSTLTGLLPKIRELFLERILRETQPVAYNQIKEGILPINYHTIVLSKTYNPPSGSPTEAGELKVYMNEENPYEADSITYRVFA